VYIENSIYIIKPEAISFSKEIHEILIFEGLQIIKFRQDYLSAIIIERLYFDCPPNIIEATKHFMLNKICEVGIVSGFDAVNLLFEICGTETNPANCKDGTIRKLFGFHDFKYYNGIRYFQNSIHRPKTKHEALKDIQLLDTF